jgi:uncharacterized protein (DUF362 family)
MRCFASLNMTQRIDACIKACCYTTLALGAFCATSPVTGQTPSSPPAPSPSPTKSIVYMVHNPDAIHDYKTNPRVVRVMVDRLVEAATGEPDVGKAWASLVSPNDKIGIKISAAGGELFTTHHAVVNAIVDGLAAAGHSPKSIIVWDRSLEGIKGAGYKPATDDYRLKAISPRTGYDRKAIFSAPMLGTLVWGDLDFKANLGKVPLLSDMDNTSNISHFSRIVSSEVTKIINVPVMSNSTTNGIAGCLYNVTIPNLDNWRRFAQGMGFGTGSVADIYSDPMIAKKVVFNLMDGLVAQYAGGPESQPNFAVHYATLYASKDPVALDSVAIKQLDQWRKNAKFSPIGELGSYVQYAQQLGLGNAEMKHIEIRNISR